MRKIRKADHCSLDKDMRILFNRKQYINNSNDYTEEEKELLINELNIIINKLLELRR